MTTGSKHTGVSRTRWAKNVVRMTDKKEAHKTLAGITGAKTPFYR